MDSDASVALGVDSSRPKRPDAGTVVTALPGALALGTQKARRGASGGTPGLVELKVTISNGVGGTPVLSNPLLFKLRGSDGLAVSGGAGTAKYVAGDACNPAGEVVSGASYSCVLTFQLGSNAEPVELSYSNPADPRTAKANVALEACTACGSKCTYLDSDEENCGKCGLSERSATGWVCNAGVPTCNTSGQTVCGDKCVDLKTDEANCGVCGKQIDQNSLCQNGNVVCDTRNSGVVACGSTCADLNNDEANCGACGKKCTRSSETASTRCLRQEAPARRPMCESSIVVRTFDDCQDSACVAAGMISRSEQWRGGPGPGGGGRFICWCRYAPL